MLQVQLTAPYTFLSSRVEKPKLQKGEVLLKIHSFGICGSDIQMYHGRHKYMSYPVVIGHEVSAIVEETGEGVESLGLEAGDKVTVEPQIVCGACYPCSIGRFNVCEKLRVMGVHSDGFCREYAAVDASYLHRCPPDMNEEWLSLIEPVAVGIGAVKRGSLGYKGISGLNVAVVGAGPIGICAVQAAKALGAKETLLADISAAKLDFAKRFGLDRQADTSKVSLSEAIETAFGPAKADVIIDAAGVPASMHSILSAARRSSVIVVTGNFKEPLTFEVPVIQRQEISIVGHMMYVREDFEDAIRFMESGSIKVGGLITQRFPVSELKEAFEFIDGNPEQVMKAIVTL
jgi:L-iditol 2-dehydrogenase